MYNATALVFFFYSIQNPSTYRKLNFLNVYYIFITLFDFVLHKYFIIQLCFALYCHRVCHFKFFFLYTSNNFNEINCSKLKFKQMLKFSFLWIIWRCMVHIYAPNKIGNRKLTSPNWFFVFWFYFTFSFFRTFSHIYDYCRWSKQKIWIRKIASNNQIKMQKDFKIN